jgi:BlaI family penicillinase repressor
VPKSLPRLPDAEQEVMHALWQCEIPAERAAVAGKLTRAMAETTLLTLLTRLAERNFIAIEKVGRRSVYTPLVSKQDYLAARSRSFIDTLCGGSLPTFAAALCEGGLTREELQELRALLERDEL